MQTLSEHDKVEEITLPKRYRAHGKDLAWKVLISLYEELKKEHYQALQRIDEENRHAWSIERMAVALNDLIDAQKNEIFRLREAGRYAIYGKPPPDLSTVDEYGNEEQDSREAK